MQYNYNIFTQSPEAATRKLSAYCRKRRLEKGWSRRTLSEQSGVPAPTISKFETTGKISLGSFSAIASALGYFDELTSVMSEPKYSTAQELETINANRHRTKGR